MNDMSAVDRSGEGQTGVGREFPDFVGEGIPEHLAVALPDDVGDEVGAALGIPGITAHRAVFSDGPVGGKTLLVHGVLGGVSSLAAQLARWGGATVIATVTRSSDLDRVDPAVAAHAVALDQSDPAGAIREFASEGVDRIVEVAYPTTPTSTRRWPETTLSSPHTRPAPTDQKSRFGQCFSLT
jgi:NADPH:quinone reductase-like Zn-dependent oxidoreductase